MKKAWVQLRNWSHELAVAAIESGADALVLPEGCSKAKSLGRITVIGPGGDLEAGRDVFFEPLGSPEDEACVMELLRTGKTVVVSGGWEVIPVENLLAAGCGSLLVQAGSAGEIELALGVLEKGVAGVVICSEEPGEVRRLVSIVKRISESLPLKGAAVEKIAFAGMGDRVCVDTCSNMASGEGMLVGNSSGFLFLVQAETEENPYVAPRPFRVNAGPVHSYVRVPNGRTRYLSELRAGSRVLVFNPEGNAGEAVVGRVKIEKRPLVLIEASLEGRTGTVILQNAETIRLTRPGGEAVSVARLKPGDTVLVAEEAAGRHFGMKVEETIEEK